MNHEPSLIEEFIDMIKAYPNFELSFELNDKTLNGLKLKKYVQYPWKNKKEEKAYAVKYMDPETKDAYLENIKWMNISSYERIHILYSWAFVLRMSSVFILLFTILSMVMHAYAAALIYFIGSILLFILNKWYTRKAINASFSRSLGESIFRLAMDKLNIRPEEKIELPGKNNV